MSYKIAVASSDGTKIDETFGSARSFLIYEVTDKKYEKTEERAAALDETQNASGSCGDKAGCGNGSGNGCETGSGCGGASLKVELIADCRCVVCKKIGFQIQKQLERKAISAFDVSCSVEEALSKISDYYSHIDNHKSLRAEGYPDK